MTGSNTLPLAGLRVLDLSAFLSGPLATAMLADQGAEVVKVEPPEGDVSRAIGPAKGRMSATFIACNRGKRGLALDLKSAGGRALVRELAARADVLAENFRPGVMARLGLDDAALALLNPRLVHLSITGFGRSGPYATGRAYDAVIQAIAGMSAAHRDRASGEPSLLSTTVCDKLTALTAAQAVSAALFARERDGRGRRVEIAMLDAAVAFQWPDAMFNHAFIDDAPEAYPPFGGTTRPYRTRDGFVAVMMPQTEEFRAFCLGLGLDEMASDPRYATTPLRHKASAELRARFEPLVAQWGTEELVDALRAAGVPIGRVNEHGEVLTDPQVMHSGMLAEVAHGALGRVRLPHGAARWDGLRGPAPGPAPDLGEHGTQVLREWLLIDDDRIAALRREGVLLGTSG